MTVCWNLPHNMQCNKLNLKNVFYFSVLTLESGFHMLNKLSAADLHPIPYLLSEPSSQLLPQWLQSNDLERESLEPRAIVSRIKYQSAYRDHQQSYQIHLILYQKTPQGRTPASLCGQKFQFQLICELRSVSPLGEHFIVPGNTPFPLPHSLSSSFNHSNYPINLNPKAMLSRVLLLISNG